MNIQTLFKPLTDFEGKLVEFAKKRGVEKPARA